MSVESGDESTPDSTSGVPAQVKVALPWVEAHCRFVTTKLPRRGIGVQLAEDLLASVPEAVARCVPDLRGSTPEFLDQAAAYGLHAKVPSRRAGREMLKLLVDLTPMIELRGNHFWVLWIVRLTDPDMLAQLKRGTPRSQSLARPLGSAELRPSSLQLAKALAAAEAELAKERAVKVGLQAHVVELQADLVSERSRRLAGQQRERRERERRDEAERRPGLAEAAHDNQPRSKMLEAHAALLKMQVRNLEVELESMRSRCLSAYEGLAALQDEKRELERRLAKAQV